MAYEHRPYLTIDLTKVRNNFKSLQAKAKNCKVMPVLKANAYGLGAVKIGESLREEGVKHVGVADIAEAHELSHLFSEISILGDVLDKEVEEIINAGWYCPITDFGRLAHWNDLAKKINKKLKVQLYIDTGMGQLGLLPSTVTTENLEALRALQHIEVHGVYSHFAHAGFASEQGAVEQLNAFSKACQLISGFFPKIKRHIANSNGLIYLPESTETFDYARVGLAVYGLLQNFENNISLQSVLNLTAPIMAVRTLEANANIGYLHTYKTPTKTKTATVAFGYADGYPLGASNKGVVLINGQRCPVLGRVSMDYITIDVSNVKNEIKSGDDCVLLGKQGEEEIFLEEWASWKNSIVYDITCSFGRRVCKQYTNS